jgi:type IV secretory pathway VirB10-like protein
MSILGTIISSILGGRAEPTPPPAAMSAGMSARQAAQPRANAPVVAPTPPQATESKSPQAPDQPEPSKPQPLPAAHAKTPPAATPRQVDVAAILDNLAEETDEELDWRRSIVDLMKLLKLDSGLTARKALAKELKYTGDTKDSAAMNVWLHKQVMAKLVEGGGKLPSDVKH